MAANVWNISASQWRQWIHAAENMSLDDELRCETYDERGCLEDVSINVVHWAGSTRQNVASQWQTWQEAFGPTADSTWATFAQRKKGEWGSFHMELVQIQAMPVCSLRAAVIAPP